MVVLKLFLVLPPSNDVLYSHIFKSCLPPTGMAYLAGVLTDAGHEVQIVDMSAQKMSFREFHQLLSSERPAVVGIYCALTRVQQAMQVAQIAKKEGALIVLGGPESTINDEELLLNHHVDAVVRGEGELTFLDLVSKIQENSDFSKVNGISYRDHDRIVVNPPRSLIHDLDALPFPPWHLFPVEKYHLFNYLSVLTIASSRGCTFACDFCAVPQMYHNTWRGRSPENVVDELEFLHKRFNPSLVLFSDDSFMVDMERVNAICDEIIRRGLSLPWLCLARTDLSVRLMEKMKKANCVALLFNIESHLIRNKNVIFAAFKNAKKARIFGIANLVFGFPGETMTDCYDHLRFILSLNADHAMFFRNMSGNALDAATLGEIERKAYRRFYLRKRYHIAHVTRAISNFVFSPSNNGSLAVNYARWFIHAIRYVSQLSS